MNESSNLSMAQVNTDPLVSINADDLTVSIQVTHKGKTYSAHFVIPPDKQDMVYIREMTSGLAASADRKIKELLLGQPIL